MKITNVNIPAEYTNDGLCKVSMNRLSDIVIIAGKNGSGKSRLLRRIQQCLNEKPNNGAIIQLNEDIKNYKSAIHNQPGSTNVKQWELAIENANKLLTKENHLVLDETADHYLAVNFVPNNLDLLPSSSITTNEQINRHDSCTNMGTNELSRNALAFIQTEYTRYLNATHPKITMPEVMKIQAIDSFSRLNNLIHSFLGVNIEGNLDGICTIFGLTLDNSQLSNGQKVLLQLCIAIHAQGASLKNLILLLDEPENHLHPAALIEFVDNIQRVLINGQIWIATHSINLLSYYDTSYIWYMDNNNITYSGRAPEIVLKGLLGTDEQIYKLQQFIGMPAELASNQFAYECLFAPRAVMTGTDDKQTQQIRSVLANYPLNRTIRLLDFGAGKGRLADAIYFSEENIDKESIKDWLDYYAFDEYSADRNYCEDAINRIYGNSNNRYFNSMHDILGTIDQQSCDAVIMSNVLHEVDPLEWINLFKKDSTINRLLKDDGYLFIVEDLLIPIGEKPHKNGFFILSLAEIKTLFSITEQNKDFNYTDADGNSRLLAYMIPKQCLSNISSESIQTTMKILKDHAMSEIARLRAGTDYKSGKLLGFWTQQLANTILFLND